MSPSRPPVDRLADTAPAEVTADSVLARRFQAIGAPTRLNVVRLLSRYRPRALPAGEIARLLAVHPATLSAHLATLEEAGLVTAERHGRVVAYGTVEPALADLRAALDLDGAAPRVGAGAPGANVAPVSVLFLCTRNSARSIMAEALLNRLGGGRFHAVSAGSRPAGAVDPMVVAFLTELRYPVTGLASKSWSAFSGPTAPMIDLVISVCDDAAREPCPAFIGPVLSAHWGIADPVAAPAATRAEAVRAAYRQLSARLTELATLDWSAMSLDARAAALHRIARMDGATPLALIRAA